MYHNSFNIMNRYIVKNWFMNWFMSHESILFQQNLWTKSQNESIYGSWESESTQHYSWPTLNLTQPQRFRSPFLPSLLPSLFIHPSILLFTSLQFCPLPLRHPSLPVVLPRDRNAPLMKPHIHLISAGFRRGCWAVYRSVWNIRRVEIFKELGMAKSSPKFET